MREALQSRDAAVTYRGRERCITKSAYTWPSVSKLFLCHVGGGVYNYLSTCSYIREIVKEIEYERNKSMLCTLQMWCCFRVYTIHAALLLQDCAFSTTCNNVH